jgi:DNA gyrase subunit A
MIVTKNGTMIRVPVDGVRITGRSAQGVKLIDLAEDDIVMSATPVEPMEDEGAPAEPGAAEEISTDSAERMDT